MGACTFIDVARGKNAREAFNHLVEQAQWEYGHGGYTGTIAEKTSYEVIRSTRILNKESALNYAEILIEEDDSRICDKWGPCGCIEVPNSEQTDGTKLFIFFGWASS
jgi:hypothetical protein